MTPNQEDSMKTKRLVVGVLALAIASTAGATDLVTSAVRVGNNHSAACRVVNVSSSAVTAEIQMVDVITGGTIDTRGPVDIGPGEVTATTYYGPQKLLMCRFVRASKTKMRATMNVNDVNGDYTDTLVVPAT
jgi:hypothetical protein